MNKQIQFTDQLNILMNFTSMMMELIQTAKDLGIDTKDKNRAELVREIQLAEGRACAVSIH